MSSFDHVGDADSSFNRLFAEVRAVRSQMPLPPGMCARDCIRFIGTTGLLGEVAVCRRSVVKRDMLTSALPLSDVSRLLNRASCLIGELRLFFRGAGDSPGGGGGGLPPTIFAWQAAEPLAVDRRQPGPGCNFVCLLRRARPRGRSAGSPARARRRGAPRAFASDACNYVAAARRAVMPQFS